jgi:hypothetical protein
MQIFDLIQMNWKVMGNSKPYLLFFCLDTKEPKNQGCKIIWRNSAARFTEIFKLAALRQKKFLFVPLRGEFLTNYFNAVLSFLLRYNGRTSTNVILYINPNAQIPLPNIIPNPNIKWLCTLYFWYGDWIGHWDLGFDWIFDIGHLKLGFTTQINP